MTAALATAWSVQRSRTEQAAFREYLGAGNSALNGDGVADPRDIAPTTVLVNPPKGVQDPSASGTTTDAGDSRTHATASMPRRATVTAATARPFAHYDSRKETFSPLQEWEGTVLDRRLNAIRVRLLDKTNHGPGGSRNSA